MCLWSFPNFDSQPQRFGSSQSLVWGTTNRANRGDIVTASMIGIIGDSNTGPPTRRYIFEGSSPGGKGFIRSFQGEFRRQRSGQSLTVFKDKFLFVECEVSSKLEFCFKLFAQKSIRNWSLWSNYSDLTRPQPKWWFSKGNPLISGKSRLVKYYSIWPDPCLLTNSLPGKSTLLNALLGQRLLPTSHLVKERLGRWLQTWIYFHLVNMDRFPCWQSNI